MNKKLKKLTNYQIRKIKNGKANLDKICYSYELSEEFIEEFAYKFDWYLICTYQNLSENFIRKFKNKVYWSAISDKYNFSDSFIEEFQDKIFWHMLAKSQKLSKQMVEKFFIKRDLIYIPLFKLNINNEFTWKTFV
jgi:hypothetical protein